MSGGPRRNHSPEFKAKVALAALNGEEPPARLAEQFDIHPNQITQWKNQLLEREVTAFGTGKTHLATAVGVQAVTHSHRRIGFLSTIVLVNALEQERAAGKQGQLDLVILDELGYLPFSQLVAPCCST